MKHIIYIKIAKFVILPPIPKKAYRLSLEFAGAATNSLIWKLMNTGAESSVYLAFATDFFRVIKQLIRRILCRRTGSKRRRQDEIKNHILGADGRIIFLSATKTPSESITEVKEIPTVSWIYKSQLTIPGELIEVWMKCIILFFFFNHHLAISSGIVGLGNNYQQLLKH